MFYTDKFTLSERENNKMFLTFCGKIILLNTNISQCIVLYTIEKNQINFSFKYIC